MTGVPSSLDNVRDFAPKYAELTEKVLFGDIWQRPALAKRDRSLITLATLVALARQEELRTHIPLALSNGVTEQEIVELITHLAFYAGWPAAASTLRLAQQILAERI